MRRLIAWMTIAAALAATAAEDHADLVVRRILDNVAKIKAADPQAVPMAFWDFDGTILKGDLSIGGVHADGGAGYKGMIRRVIEAGYTPMYDSATGWKQFLEKDYPRLKEIGRWIAWPYLAQMMHGTAERDVEALATAAFAQEFRTWYFASSVKILRALEKAGVENYIVSASPEVFVRNASATLGLPRERFRGMRTEIVAGRITVRFLEPVLNGEGKVTCVRQMIVERPHGVGVAAFGNSYSSDGDFLRFIATQQTLPGGAKGTAMMINGGASVKGYAEHFITVDQSETVGEARCD